MTKPSDVLDDDWVVFALDVVEAPNEAHPGVHVLWAGTTHAEVNKRMGELITLGMPLASEGFFMEDRCERGVVVFLASGLYEHEQVLGKFFEAFSRIARVAAEERSCSFFALEPGSFPEGFMRMAAMLNVDVKLNPELFRGTSDDEGTEEEE